MPNSEKPQMDTNRREIFGMSGSSLNLKVFPAIVAWMGGDSGGSKISAHQRSSTVFSADKLAIN
jgi:hypothetical protein